MNKTDVGSAAMRGECEKDVQDGCKLTEDEWTTQLRCGNGTVRAASAFGANNTNILCFGSCVNVPQKSARYREGDSTRRRQDKKCVAHGSGKR